MEVREATFDDLQVCLALDPSVQTEYVWQMMTQNGDQRWSVQFQRVHLPRAMRVLPPYPPEHLLESWDRGDGVWVAEEEGEVWGYVVLRPQPETRMGWISYLVVGRPYRRRGVGGALLRAVQAVARKWGLVQLMAAVQTKNDPAICFFEKRGFVFCGYNDRYYPNGDIALFLGLRLKV